MANILKINTKTINIEKQKKESDNLSNIGLGQLT